MVSIQTVATKPIPDQKMGTSGLRKRVKLIESTPNYLENFVQSILNVVLDTQQSGDVSIVLGGDGRYFNKQAIQVIVQMLFANRREKQNIKVLIAENGVMSTPAVSAVIRKYKTELGGLILTASHNPGGPENDWGIKYNAPNGGPANETTTDKIYQETLKISEYKIARDLPSIDFAKVGPAYSQDHFSVEIIDSVKDYLELLKTIFDFDAIKKLLSRKDFNFTFDAMHGATGIYSEKILKAELGAGQLLRSDNLPDFGGAHPDPNLTYAPELVELMFDKQGNVDLGAASDGDGDRNMIIGKDFFVTPSDSVAVIADYAQKCIPYFKKSGIKGLARSMPTSTAIDRVAQDLNVKCYETPTGWKFFGNLFDDGKLSICGEESFGTGSDHIREKDGLWAVLSWLSILAYEFESTGDKVTVASIVKQHWKKFGRSFYVRYDYENVDGQGANDLVQRISEQIQQGGGDLLKAGTQYDDYKVESSEEFEYEDPVDKSVTKKQGLIVKFTDGSRFVIRLSGTGSSGATVRLYMEKYIPYTQDQHDLIMSGDSKELVKPLFKVAQNITKLNHYTQRESPTVIT
ncbi:phosphoglucomutase [Acrasis kona]|uniref:phosphoglucomutase (alpha-D-glucose-1,6-bisphosphate-dependent) n=1 Tax=Acrasis kona TaxID=1008807 RepID=A0AAW2ZHG4_9EUKA